MLAKPTGHTFTLPVRHYAQLDNTGGEGYRECFLTSAAMTANYLLDGEIAREAAKRDMAEPEDFYATILRKFGDTTDWNAQVRALRSLGIECYFSQSASLSDVSHSLYCGVPVVIGTAYKASGHIVVVVGRNPKGWIVLCPNGIRNGASNNWIERFWDESDVKPDFFSWNLLKRVFVDMGDEAGYALFVTAIRGVSTGVRSGM